MSAEEDYFEPERQMPHNSEAEQGVLGGLLLSPEGFELIEGRVDADDFFNPSYARIFEAMLALNQRGQPIDILVLKDELKNNEQLELVGGASALAALMESVPTGAHVEYYAQIVRDRAIQRRLIEAATTIVRRATHPEGSTSSDLLDESERAIFDVAERGVSNEPARMKDVLHEAFLKIQEAANNKDRTITGFATDFHELDELLTGLHEEELIIIAGRPSMGKSTFALNLARKMSVNHKYGVLIFSLEMSQVNIAQNMICAQGKIDAQRLRKGTLSNEEFTMLGRASGELGQAPVYIDDTAGISLAELRGKTRRLKARYGIDVVIIDYLQLVTASNRAAARSREQEISEISRGLKALAKELKIPVIALSQLNRKATDRTDNRPQLSDLRESGAIEQDADVVMLIHRPDYYNKEDHPGQSEIIVAKQRNGPTDSVFLTFVGNKLLFENLSLRDQQEYVPDQDL